MAEISNPICDYCASSRNSEIQARAKECPGKFGKESEMVNGERKIRNPKCPRLIEKRKQREEKKRKKTDGGNTNQRDGKRSRETKKDLKCARCGSTNHLAKDCRQPDNRTCYKCGKSGHIARDCTNDTNDGGPNRGNSWGNNRRRVNAVARRDNTPAWANQNQQRDEGWGRDRDNNQQGWGRDRDNNHGWR